MLLGSLAFPIWLFSEFPTLSSRRVALRFPRSIGFPFLYSPLPKRALCFVAIRVPRDYRYCGHGSQRCCAPTKTRHSERSPRSEESLCLFSASSVRLAQKKTAHAVILRSLRSRISPLGSPSNPSSPSTAPNPFLSCGIPTCLMWPSHRYSNYSPTFLHF